MSSAILAWDANPEMDIAGYRLSYGTSPGVYDQVIETQNTTEVPVTNLTEGQTYYFVVAAFNQSGQTGPNSDEISYFVEPEITPSPDGWTVVSSDPSIPGHPAAAAIDGKAETFWESPVQTGDHPLLSEIQIDLSSSLIFNGLSYLPRQDGSLTGTIGAYEIFVSNDGISWGNPVASGTFLRNHELKDIRFGTVTARYILLRGSSSVSSETSISVAEIDLIQDTTPPPVTTNTAPTATAASITLNEDAPQNIQLQGADIDGNPLTFSVVGFPINGTLAGSPPNLIYTPKANFNGTDTIKFKVRDGRIDSAPATVSLTIRPINDAPLVAHLSVSTTRNQSLAIPLSGSDVEGNALTFAIASQPNSGSLSGTPPNLVYTPGQNFTGTDSFSYKANDGAVDSQVASVSILVTHSNQAPLAGSASKSTQEDTALPITLTATDADGDALAFSVISPPSHGSLTGTAPNLTYIPAANFHGQDQLSFKVNDGSIDSPTATVAITVSPVNDAPVTASASFSTSKGTALPILLTATDPEKTTCTFTVLTQPQHGTLSGTAPNLSYLPHSSFQGSDQFTFKANDGSLDSAPATVSITVTNAAPVVANRSLTTAEDKPVAIVLSGTDANGDTLTFAVVAQPSNGTLTGTPPNLTYTPRPNFFGSDQIRFTASDGSLISASATISISVTSVNDAPAVATKALQTLKNQPLPIDVTGNDVENDALTYLIVEAPRHGRLGGEFPQLVYTPDLDYIGDDMFTFKANDGSLDSLTATISISISGEIVVVENSAPLFTSPSFNATATAGTPFAGLLTASDPDGDSLVFSKASGPAWLTISANGSFSGTAPESAVGRTTVVAKVQDTSGASATASLLITVSAANHAPVFVSDVITRPAGTEKVSYWKESIADSASDPDAGDRLSFAKISGPSWLRVAANGALSGTPSPNSAGIHSFIIHAKDNHGAYAKCVLEIPIVANRLPLPWKLNRLGDEPLSDPATFASGIFTLGGSGTLFGKVDAGNFGWQNLSSDGSITARIRKIDDTGKDSRIGLMVRQSLAPGARQAFIGVDGNGKLHWRLRSDNNASTKEVTQKGAKPANTWLRLERNGNTILAYRSNNGRKWEMVTSSRLNLPKNCYIGLTVSSGDDEVRNTSSFSNVRVAR
ncbi:MAG: Ig-like domain-containing protein [Verrucomicrobiota bacterium]